MFYLFISILAHKYDIKNVVQIIVKYNVAKKYNVFI